MADPNAQYNFDSQTENDFEKITPAGEAFDHHVHHEENEGMNTSGAGSSDAQDAEVSTTTQGEDEPEEDRFNTVDVVGASESDAYVAHSPSDPFMLGESQPQSVPPSQEHDFAPSSDPLIALDDDEDDYEPQPEAHQNQGQDNLLFEEPDILQPSAPLPEAQPNVDPLIDIASSPGPGPESDLSNQGFGLVEDVSAAAAASLNDFKTDTLLEPEPEPIPSSTNKPLQNDDFDLSPFETQNKSKEAEVVTESVQSSEPVEKSEGGSFLKGLDPRVVELIYWRDVKRSGVVFGSMLVVLISLATFSLVSVLAYLSLAVLTVTFSFVLYKKVMAAVQKSNDGHPFKTLLEMDISLNEDKVKTVIRTLLNNHNKTVHELRRLFLVEDIVDSIKFGLLLWVFTYVGCLLNGMTLIILGVILLFTMPKVYETYQVQIDNYIGLAKAQINNVLAIVQSKIPFLKKKEKAQ